MEWKRETLQSCLKLNKERLIFLFCSGLLLVVLAMPSGNEKEAKGTGDQPVSWNAEGVENQMVAESRVEYETQLEQRIRTLLDGVEGVGETEVMVMVKPQEQNLMFEEEEAETVLGVIISADGGGSAVVKTEISEAMEALFGLPPHKIKVLKRVKKGV